MKHFSYGLRFLLPIFIAIVPTIASAAVFQNIGQVADKLCGVVDILFTGTLILTIVFVLLAAIKYITKGSDPKAVGEAHQMLIWAAIGFAIALFANTVPSIVAGIIGSGADASGC